MPGKIKILLDIFWVLFQAASDVEKRTHYENRLFKMPRRARWFKGKEQFSENTWTYAPRLQNLFTRYRFRVPDEATFCAHVLVVASHTNTPTTSGLAGELQNFHSLMWKRVCLQEVWCKRGSWDGLSRVCFILSPWLLPSLSISKSFLIAINISLEWWL